MTDAEKVALWQQRIVEAHAGMYQLLVEEHAAHETAAWLHLQAEMFRDLPGPEERAPGRWQRAFFRVQALLEQFVLSRLGPSGLQQWASATAVAYAALQADRGRGTADTAERIARQAQLYSSEHEVLTATPPLSVVSISRCRIWEYREHARREGVPLVLDSPCGYCTLAITANARSKGHLATHRLTADGDRRGCDWRVTELPPHPC
jgi:hypothetical protein